MGARLTQQGQWGRRRICSCPTPAEHPPGPQLWIYTRSCPSPAPKSWLRTMRDARGRPVAPQRDARRTCISSKTALTLHDGAAQGDVLLARRT